MPNEDRIIFIQYIKMCKIIRLSIRISVGTLILPLQQEQIKIVFVIFPLSTVIAGSFFKGKKIK